MQNAQLVEFSNSGSHKLGLVSDQRAIAPTPLLATANSINISQNIFIS